MNSRAAFAIRRPKAARIWLPAAVLLLAALLVYCVFQGVRYWHLSGRSDQLDARISQLSAPASIADLDALREQAGAEEARSGALLKSFDGADPTRLIALTSRAAREAGVNLASVSLDTPATETVDGLRYSVQPLNLVVQGEVEKVLAFLTDLQKEAPLSAVGRIALSRLDSVPSVQVRLLFHHSPRVVEGEQGAS